MSDASAARTCVFWMLRPGANQAWRWRSAALAVCSPTRPLTPSDVPQAHRVLAHAVRRKTTGAVPADKLQFTFTTSSGAGGQNVNKVNTKATLKWDVVASPSLPEDVRRRFLQKYSRRISKVGTLVLVSQRFRDQGRNVADCLEKLRHLLAEVAVAPTPRKKTKPSRAARQRPRPQSSARRVQRRARPAASRPSLVREEGRDVSG